MILLAVLVILLTAPAVGGPADLPSAGVRDTSTIAVSASTLTPAAAQKEQLP
jgi:hypothetical protein